jgi:hypothetical protein
MTATQTEADLYGTDFALWSEQQAQALRSAAREGSNAAIDWGNVAEEIESLGTSERRALASHVRTVIEHLMKLHSSAAADPPNGWRRSIRHTRAEIESILKSSPSLRRELPRIVAEEMATARRLVAGDTTDYGEDPAGLNTLVFDADDVLGPRMP